jgi:hypothetical protein
MKSRYRVTFDVDGECWWEVQANSPGEARDAAIAWFRGERFWAQRYPETPTCTVERLPEASGRHGDVGPFA